MAVDQPLSVLKLHIVTLTHAIQRYCGHYNRLFFCHNVYRVAWLSGERTAKLSQVQSTAMLEEHFIFHLMATHLSFVSLELPDGTAKEI